MAMADVALAVPGIARKWASWEIEANRRPTGEMRVEVELVFAVPLALACHA